MKMRRKSLLGFLNLQSVRVEAVSDFNRRMGIEYPRQYQMLFINQNTGERKKTGYVASVGQHHFWSKTKSGALRKAMKK